MRRPVASRKTRSSSARPWPTAVLSRPSARSARARSAISKCSTKKAASTAAGSISSVSTTAMCRQRPSSRPAGSSNRTRSPRSSRASAPRIIPRLPNICRPRACRSFSSARRRRNSAIRPFIPISSPACRARSARRRASMPATRWRRIRMRNSPFSRRTTTSAATMSPAFEMCWAPISTNASRSPPMRPQTRRSSRRSSI